MLHTIGYLLLAVFAVLPLVAGLGYALLYSVGLAGALQQGFTLYNWQKLFSESQVITSFAYSAAISLVALVLSVCIALYISLSFRKQLAKGFLSYLVYLPMAFPAMVAAFFFFQFLSKGGMASRLMFQLGVIDSISSFPDLVNDRFGIGMIATHVFLSAPFFSLLFTNLYATERLEDYLLLAKSLGATPRQAIRKLAIPMLLQKSFPTLMLYFIFMFGAYEIPLILGRSNPEMVSVMAVRKLQKFNLLDIPQGYAIAMLYTLFVFVFITVLLRKRNSSYNV